MYNYREIGKILQPFNVEKLKNLVIVTKFLAAREKDHVATHQCCS